MKIVADAGWVAIFPIDARCDRLALVLMPGDGVSTLQALEESGSRLMVADDVGAPVEMAAAQRGGGAAPDVVPLRLARPSETISVRIEGPEPPGGMLRLGHVLSPGWHGREEFDLSRPGPLKAFAAEVLHGEGRLAYRVAFLDEHGRELTREAGAIPRASAEDVEARRSAGDGSSGWRAPHVKLDPPHEARRAAVEWSVSADVVLARLPAILPSHFTSRHLFECAPFRHPVLHAEIAGRPGKATQHVAVRFHAGDRVISSPLHGFKLASDGWSTRKFEAVLRDAPIRVRVPIPVPMGATRGEIRFEVAERVRLEPAPFVVMAASAVDASQGTVAAAASGLEADPTVVISTTAGPHRPDVLRLRSHYLAERFATLGHRTWVVPLADKIDLFELGPNLRQFRRRDFARVAERMLQARRPGIFVCSSLCDSETVLFVDGLKRRGWFVLYEVRDDMEAMRVAGFSQWYAPELERRLCTSADLVTCVSAPIRERVIALGARPERALVIPNGLPAEDLVVAERSWGPGADRRGRTRIGYFGHLFPGRFDVEAVRQAALELPEVGFDLVGPGLKEPEALDVPNVTLHGQITTKAFYAMAQGWDLGLLPFRPNRLTHSLDPIKHYQYLAAGLRVVSTPMPALEDRPMTVLQDPGTGLGRRLREVMERPVSEDEGEAVLRFLRASTWEGRCEATLAAIRAVGGDALRWG